MTTDWSQFEPDDAPEVSGLDPQLTVDLRSKVPLWQRQGLPEHEIDRRVADLVASRGGQIEQPSAPAPAAKIQAKPVVAEAPLDWSQFKPDETLDPAQSGLRALVRGGGLLMHGISQFGQAIDPVQRALLAGAEQERQRQGFEEGGNEQPARDTLDALDPWEAMSRRALAYNKSAVPEDSDRDELFNAPAGIAEGLLATGTGVGTSMAGGLASLGDLINRKAIKGVRALGVPIPDVAEPDPGAVLQSWQEKAYQPRLAMGQEVTQGLAAPLLAMGELGTIAADRMQDAGIVGPEGATVIKSAFELVPTLIGGRRAPPRPYQFPPSMVNNFNTRWANRPQGGVSAAPGGGGPGGPAPGAAPGAPRPGAPGGGTWGPFPGDVMWDIYQFKLNEWVQNGRVGPEPAPPDYGPFNAQQPGAPPPGAAPGGPGGPPPPGGPSARPSPGAGRAGTTSPPDTDSLDQVWDQTNQRLIGGPRPPAQPVLPAPSIQVTPEGVARTSRDVTLEARRGRAAGVKANKEEQNRIDLGLTPDIRRVMAQKWAAAEKRAADDAANLEARQPINDLTQQRTEDMPPWWQESVDQAKRDLQNEMDDYYGPSIRSMMTSPPPAPKPGYKSVFDVTDEDLAQRATPAATAAATPPPAPAPAAPAPATPAATPTAAKDAQHFDTIKSARTREQFLGGWSDLLRTMPDKTTMYDSGLDMTWTVNRKTSPNTGRESFEVDAENKPAFLFTEQPDGSFRHVGLEPPLVHELSIQRPGEAAPTKAVKPAPAAKTELGAMVQPEAAPTTRPPPRVDPRTAFAQVSRDEAWQNSWNESRMDIADTQKIIDVGIEPGTRKPLTKATRVKLENSVETLKARHGRIETQMRHLGVKIPEEGAVAPAAPAAPAAKAKKAPMTPKQGPVMSGGKAEPPKPQISPKLQEMDINMLIGDLSAVRRGMQGNPSKQTLGRLKNREQIILEQLRGHGVDPQTAKQTPPSSIPTPESLGDTRHYTLDWRAGKWNEDLRGKQRKPGESEMAIAPLTEVDFKAHIKPRTRFKTLDELRQHYPGATHFRMIQGMAGKKPLIQFAGAGTLESLRPTSSDKVEADLTKIFKEEQAAKAKPKIDEDERVARAAEDDAWSPQERKDIETAQKGIAHYRNLIENLETQLKAARAAGDLRGASWAIDNIKTAKSHLVTHEKFLRSKGAKETTEFTATPAAKPAPKAKRGKVEPATPAGIEAAAETVIESKVPMKQARDSLLQQIDARLKKANTDPWPKKDDAERDRIIEAAGYVTLNVPGDGKFRIVNNVDRLTAFRDQVQKQFKMPHNAPLMNIKPYESRSLRLTDEQRKAIMAEADEEPRKKGERHEEMQGPKPTKVAEPLKPMTHLTPEETRQKKKEQAKATRAEKLRQDVIALAGPAAKYLTPSELANLDRGTAAAFAELRASMPTGREYANISLAGKAKRGWYRKTARAIYQVFGKADGDRFTALLASGSPQTGVEENLLNTLNFWANWVKAGRPADARLAEAVNTQGVSLALLHKRRIGGIDVPIRPSVAKRRLERLGFPMDLYPLARQQLEIMGESVQGDGTINSVLGGWVGNSLRSLNSEDPENLTISGPKVNSFMLNTRGVMHEVANDAWVANYMGVPQKLFQGALSGSGPGKGPGYLAASATAREAAEHLTQMTGEKWEPAEAQETNWSWTKTAYELADDNRAEYKKLSRELPDATEARQRTIIKRMATIKAQGLTVPQLVKSGALTDELIAATPDFGNLLREPKYAQILQKAGLAKPTPWRAPRSHAPARALAGTAGQAAAPVAPVKTEVGRAARRLDQLRKDRAANKAAKAEEREEGEEGGGDLPDLPPPGDDAWRPGTTPETIRKNQYAIDDMMRRAGGSVLADDFNRMFREAGGGLLIGKKLKTLQDKGIAFLVYRHPHFEVGRILFFDKDDNVIHETAYSARLAGSTQQHPGDIATGEQFTAWLESVAPPNAVKVMTQHNHPAGTKATAKDIEAVKNDASLIPSRLKYLGEIVTNHTEFTHIAPDGTATQHQTGQRGSDPLRTVGKQHPIIGRRGIDLHEVNAYAQQLYDEMPAAHVGVMTTDGRGTIRTLSQIPINKLMSKRGAGALSTLARLGGGGQIILVGDIETVDANLMAIVGASSKGLISEVVGIHPDGTAESMMEAGIARPPPRYYQSFARRPRYNSKGELVRVGGAATEYTGTLRGEREQQTPRRPGENRREWNVRRLRRYRDNISDYLAGMTPEKMIQQEGFRQMLASTDRSGRMADWAFRAATKMFDEDPDALNLATIHEWETGQRVRDPDARAFFAQMQHHFEQLIDRIRAHDPELLQTLVENYFPHIWKDSAKARAWYESLTARNPLRGDRSFLKERKYGTIQDGMANDLEPVTTNPATLALLKLHQMEKFVNWLDFRKALRDLGYLRKMMWNERAPEGFERVDDPAFNHNEGYWAVPRDLAWIINNHLSPGLNQLPGWRGIRKIENTLVAAHLGYSAFHASMTTFDNFITSLSIAVNRMSHGDFAGAGKNMLEALASPATPFFEGKQLAEAWVNPVAADPTTRALLKALEAGGARLKMHGSEYNESRMKFVRAWRKGNLDAFEITGPFTGIRAIGDALSAVGEIGGYLVHHWLVPKQKMAARVHILKGLLDHYASDPGIQKRPGDYLGIIEAMNPDVLRHLATHAVDIVDDRLGQMAYDNQFFPKILLQFAQTILMAPGWLVGGVRTAVGGIKDLRRLVDPEKLPGPVGRNAPPGSPTGRMPRLTQRTTGFAVLALVMMAGNKLLQWLMTGEDAHGKDYWFPKTGRRNPDDSEERLQLPTYWMDHYKLATDLPQTMIHKLNPLFEMLWELYHNADYFDTQIWEPNDSRWEKAKDIARYVGKGYLPFSVTNAQKLMDKEVGMGRHVASFFGVNPAPMNISRSDFQQYVMDKTAGHAPKAPKTQAGAEFTASMHDIENQIRAGKKPDMSKMIESDRRRAVVAARAEVPQNSFKRLEFEDKIQAFSLATHKEIVRYHLIDLLRAAEPETSAVFLRKPKQERKDLLDRRRALIKEAGGRP